MSKFSKYFSAFLESQFRTFVSENNGFPYRFVCFLFDNQQIKSRIKDSVNLNVHEF